MRRYLPRVLLVCALAFGVAGACVVKPHHHPPGHSHRVHPGKHKGHHKKHKHKKHKHRGHGRGHHHH